MASTKEPHRAARAWLRRAVALAGLLTLVAGGGLREDELSCEEAIAHLSECCPSFDRGGVQCVFERGCSDADPILTINESYCITSLSCPEVTARGLCATVRALVVPEGAGGSPSHAPVCQ